MYDYLYLDIFPPTLQASPASHIALRQHLRPVAYDGHMEGGLLLSGMRPDWPLVYVTMGTVFNDAGPLRNAVDAIARLDARVLVTVGPAPDPSVVGTQPDHVRVEQSQLCLPQGADQFLNAQAVAGAGAGISLLPDAATPEAIRGAVGRLLTELSYRACASNVREDITAMPSPADVSALLEALISRR